MFAKLFQKSTTHQPSSQHNVQQGNTISTDLDPRIALHFGIPSTSSILAFDPIQRLLAVGTLDGRIKVIGGDNIEGLLISPLPLPFKHLEFLQNQGLLSSVSNDNDIQVWDIENRRITSTLHWESNITAFSVIYGTGFMYVGDEYGMVVVLKYNSEEQTLIQQPYHVSANSIAEAVGISLTNHSVIGVLLKPWSHGNRLLIAYENGLIVLWDVAKAKTVIVKGYQDLQVKDERIIDLSKDVRNESSDDTPGHEQVAKEISSLCWASSNGSILAAGYVDGDIMFWDFSMSTRGQYAENNCNVVKLQLSSGNRRLPIIALHRSENKSDKDQGCQLFVYGGDEIGSEEVISILSLDWSIGIDNLKCVGRVDLTLSGSFADMILLPSAGAVEGGDFNWLFVLTSPGQLHGYDDTCLYSLMSQQERKSSVSAVQYPMAIPTGEPYMTVGKLSLVCRDGKFSRVLSEIVSSVRLKAAHSPTTKIMNWPLTGGVPNQLFNVKDYLVERVYIGGYCDGSVRVWDATCPAFSPICVIGSEEIGMEVLGAKESVSALDFCSLNLRLAVGNKCGLVLLYELIGHSDETSLQFVTETKNEVRSIPQGNGPHCKAVFSISNSRIYSLKFANFGARLAVGFESGQVAVLDISSISVLFLTDCVPESNSPVISLAVKSYSETNDLLSSPKNNEFTSSNDPGKWVMFVLMKDGHIAVIDSSSNKITNSLSVHSKEWTAISIYILEGSNCISQISSQKHQQNSCQYSEAKNELAQTNSESESRRLEVDLDTLAKTSYFGQRFINLLILVCCEDVLCLYSLKSVIQGDTNSIRKVNLAKPCCWTALFKKDDKECRLAVFYQTGVLEIRSLPDLEVVGESSLTSILRWSFKTDMDKTMSSSDTGEIAVVNGSEFAFISLFACENNFRIPESLPCLHDKVLAAAADSSVSCSPYDNDTQAGTPGILGGIIKGFKLTKVPPNLGHTEVSKSNLTHLESIFSRSPVLESSAAIMDDQKDLEIDIDDIQIDEPIPIPFSSHKSKNDHKGKETEREKLFEGATENEKPRLRSAVEIKAKYRKAGDVTAVAAQARDKLIERQEKLEKLSERTEELQSGAENFASMANELVKNMENRKWWKL